MRRQGKLTHLTLPGGVWPFDIHLLIGRFEAFAAWASRRYGLDEPDRGHAGGMAAVVAPPEGGLDGLIWLPRFRAGHPHDEGALAHEALHVVARLLHRAGCADEEAHCYFLQWVISECHEGLRRR